MSSSPDNPNENVRESLIHHTAEIHEDAVIGPGLYIWNYSKVREHARIGSNVNIGQMVYVESHVVIGNDCKIQNAVNMFDGLTLGDRVFVGPAVTFTNDMTPRAVGDWEITTTRIEDDASIGANATIVCGITLGAGCMVGAGSVVTKDVAPRTLVVGNPARPIGFVDASGNRVDEDPGPYHA